jgi:hypothetical protein
MFSSRVLFAVVDGTVATIVSVSDEPSAGAAGTVGAVHLTVPLAPTGGVVQVSALLAVALTNATSGGSWSASTKFVEAAGP